MSQVVSPSVGRPYGLARVARVWEMSRSTLYFQKQRQHRPPREDRRGRRPIPEDTLVDAIRQVISESPWVGEGYRKVWAALRARGLRTSKGRVLRLMRANGLLAPHRRGHPHGPKAHEGTIIPSRPDRMWGIDGTATLTRLDGLVVVFVLVDHATAECLGLHAARHGTRFEAIEALRQGILHSYGRYAGAIALELAVRHDHGSPFVSDLFQQELLFLGAVSSPAFVREPEGNGCAERFIRTLKEQLLWLRRFDTLDALQDALSTFKDLYNQQWRIERHGFRSPADQRRLLLSSLSEAA